MIWIVATFFIFCGWALWKKKARSRTTTSKRSLREERTKLHIPMLIEAPHNQAFSVSSFDISLGGAYVGMTDMDQSMNRTALFGQRTGIKTGDLLRIQILAGRFLKIVCEGRVVRIEEQAKGDYPHGLGIQFTNLTKKNRKHLKQLIQDSKLSQTVA